MNQFQSLAEYEIFIYTLAEQFPSISYSTLVVARRGRTMAELRGELAFSGDYRLSVYERLTWDADSLTIEGYSYEAWKGNQKLYWYDSQPHLNDPSLSGTHPHHKHVPPDIKHHRISAPGLSLSPPNFPFLIEEINSIVAE